MSFTDYTKRADDHPNASKLAIRMAQAFSNSPKRNAEGWSFEINAPVDETNFEMALYLLKIAFKSANPKTYKDWKIKLTNSDDGGKIIIQTPYTHPAAGKPDFPLREISHLLNRVQSALALDWIKDDNGNFRNVAVFDKWEYKGLSPEKLIGNLRGAKLYCQDPSAKSFGNDLDIYLHADDKYMWSNDPATKEETLRLEPIRDVQQDIAGLCLNELQVNALAKAVGFRSPVRSK